MNSPHPQLVFDRYSYGKLKYIVATAVWLADLYLLLAKSAATAQDSAH